MRKRIRLTESELINLVQRIIEEDETMGAEMGAQGKKEYTIRNGFRITFPLYVTKLNGSTPFYVNGVEMQGKITLKPDDKIASKNCDVTLARLDKKGMVEGDYYNISFNQNGIAEFMPPKKRTQQNLRP